MSLSCKIKTQRTVRIAIPWGEVIDLIKDNLHLSGMSTTMLELDHSVAPNNQHIHLKIVQPTATVHSSEPAF